MRFREIKEIPLRERRNTRTINNSIQQMVNKFYNSDLNCAIVEFNSEEYATIYSLYSGIKKAIKSLELPLETRIISGEVYIKRLD